MSLIGDDKRHASMHLSSHNVSESHMTVGPVHCERKDYISDT